MKCIKKVFKKITICKLRKTFPYRQISWWRCLF